MQGSLPIVSAAIGAVVLFFGRKLFWLCLAAFGFAAGVELAPQLLQQPTPMLQLSIALVLGFLGALLAIMLQKVAVAIFGFLAGGRLALSLAAAFVSQGNYYWIVFLVGGIVGALLLLALFDWALIVLSSALGAELIVRAITLPKTGETITLIALTLFGIVIQSALHRRRRRVVN